MHFIYEQNEALPCLTWLCVFHRGASSVEVTHGASVETQDHFFFDGIWAGDFKTGDFLSRSAFGSGARIVKDGVVFRPPDHMLDRIFYSSDDDKLFVCNSLALILESIGDELDHEFSNYWSILTEITSGIKNFNSTLPTKNGKELSIFYWNSMQVSSELKISWMNNQTEYSFSDFSSYKNCLLRVLDSAFRNARDKARVATYEPLVLLSSGYDSTAIAALTAEIGCRNALTFPEARSKSEFVDDSGVPIAKALRLEIQQVARLAYRDFEDMPEVETYGVGSEMSSARELLSSKIVLSGYMGDTMWERNAAQVSTEIPWSLIAGHNQNELRLKWGYINLPVPFIAAREHPTINKISRSDEMKPWTLYNDYDRPICRRIAEEAGVERRLFGQKKKATGVFYALEGLFETMAPISYDSYINYFTEHTTRSRRIAALGRNTLWFLRNINERGSKKIFSKSSVYLRKGIKIPIIFPKVSSFKKGALLLQWSTSIMQMRYRNALRYPHPTYTKLDR